MKFKIVLSGFIIGSIILLIVSCKDIFEQNITNHEINLLAPPDNFQTENFTITFWWENVEGANEYELTVVEGSFDYVVTKILDSTTTENEYVMTLYPGEFEWSVRAYNNGYSTDYFIRSFTIDSTEKPQIVNIKYPNNPPNITNEQVIIFEWYESLNAENYYFELNRGSSRFYTIYTELTTLTFPDATNDRPTIPDGIYTFSIQSVNTEKVFSIASTSILTVDRTPPRVPTPKVNPDTVSLSDDVFKIEWTTYQDTGTTVIDSICVYQDTTNSTPICAEVYDSYYEISVAGKYFWKVKSIDEAGNRSDFCSLQKLIITYEK